MKTTYKYHKSQIPILIPTTVCLSLPQRRFFEFASTKSLPSIYFNLAFIALSQSLHLH